MVNLRAEMRRNRLNPCWLKAGDGRQWWSNEEQSAKFSIYFAKSASGHCCKKSSVFIQQAIMDVPLLGMLQLEDELPRPVRGTPCLSLI